MNGRSRLALASGTSFSEDSKDRDVGRERTRPECQSEELGVRAFKKRRTRQKRKLLPLRSRKADKIIRPQIF